MTLDPRLVAELERWASDGRPPQEGERLLPVAVRLVQPIGDAALPGFARETATARVQMGRVALRNLARLAEDDRVAFLVFDGPPPSPQLRAATEWAGARQVAAGDDHAWSLNTSGKATGLTGAGVTIGVIDTGIDVTHPAFWAPDGAGDPKTRILSIWDMGLTPTGTESAPDLALLNPGGGTGAPLPSGPVIGVEYEDAAINDYLKGTPPVDPPFRHRDPGDHGTPVAAVAAGDPSHAASTALGPSIPGLTEDHDLIGVAPGADICVVRLIGVGVENFNARLTDAIRYIVNRARTGRPGRPVVINMSFGTSLHNHLGHGIEHDLFADLFDATGVLGAEFPTGVLAVTAAGNERDWRPSRPASGSRPARPAGSTHGVVRTTNTGPTRFTVAFVGAHDASAPRGEWTRFEVQIYYEVTAAMRSGVDLALDTVRLSRTFEASGGWERDSRINMGQSSADWRTPSHRFWFRLVGETGLRRITDVELPPDLSYNRFRIVGEFDNILLRRRASMAACHFELEGPPGAEFLVWSGDETARAPLTLLFRRRDDGIDLRQLTTLTHMGSVRDAVSVTALDRKRTEAASFSSFGPLATMGAMAGPLWDKPDIAAPGERIRCASALPEPMLTGPAATETDPQLDTDKPSRWVDGTSIAAPFVSGAAALMLEAAPGLSAAQMRAILRDPANCRKLPDPPDPSHYAHVYGGGGLDVVKAVAAARAAAGRP